MTCERLSSRRDVSSFFSSRKHSSRFTGNRNSAHEASPFRHSLGLNQGSHLIAAICSKNFSPLKNVINALDFSDSNSYWGRVFFSLVFSLLIVITWSRAPTFLPGLGHGPPPCFLGLCVLALPVCSLCLFEDLSFLYPDSDHHLCPVHPVSALLPELLQDSPAPHAFIEHQQCTGHVLGPGHKEKIKASLLRNSGSHEERKWSQGRLCQGGDLGTRSWGNGIQNTKGISKEEEVWKETKGHSFARWHEFRS